MPVTALPPPHKRIKNWSSPQKWEFSLCLVTMLYDACTHLEHFHWLIFLKTLSGMFSHDLWNHSSHLSQHAICVALLFPSCLSQGIRQEQKSSVITLFPLRLFNLVWSGAWGNRDRWPFLMHQRRCVRSWLLLWLAVEGSCPLSRDATKAIANTPQSVPLFCCWTGLMLRIISGSSSCKMVPICLTV